MTATQPIPKDLRDTLRKAIDEMADEQLLSVHNAVLDAEIKRLRELISDDAESERESGKWDDLPGVVRAYRERKKNERRSA